MVLRVLTAILIFPSIIVVVKQGFFPPKSTKRKF